MGSAFALPGTRVNTEPLGDKDGVNDTFTLPNDEACIQASLIVYLNGQALRPDNISTSSPFKTFIISNDAVPTANDSLTCSYTVKI